MISNGLQKIKELSIGTDKIAKAYIGANLIWEKGILRSAWANTTSNISPYTKEIAISSWTVNTLVGKTIVSVKIGSFKEISKEYIKPMTNPEKISFTKPIDELTGNNDWIPQGTNVTIKYIE